MVDIQKWKTQFRKGYLELCILSLLEAGKKMYGFEMLDALGRLDLWIKEGTLYPLLNRLRSDGLLDSRWETESSTHPRKFYTLTNKGFTVLEMMRKEFEEMRNQLHKIQHEEIKK
ncbi:MAG: PadR family transcriptional regulator [Bdellovibrionota bacterium]